jgi:hypothetical protein
MADYSTTRLLTEWSHATDPINVPPTGWDRFDSDLEVTQRPQLGAKRPAVNLRDLFGQYL